MNATITNIKLSELPAPIEKILEFTRNEIDFKFSVTDNILIKEEDLLYTNVYKEYIQIIGTAVKNDKQVRLESDQLLKKDFSTELWQYWLERLTKQAEGQLNK